MDAVLLDRFGASCASAPCRRRPGGRVGDARTGVATLGGGILPLGAS
jgi:hypothetical protein